MEMKPILLIIFVIIVTLNRTNSKPTESRVFFNKNPMWLADFFEGDIRIPENVR